MRAAIVGLALVACGKSSPPELHGNFCDPQKLVLDSSWADFGPALLDGTELSACGHPYDLTLMYKNQAFEPQLKRVTDLLLAKGYREVPPDQAPAKVAVTPAQWIGKPATEDWFVHAAPRVFVTDRDQVAVYLTRFPNNAGQPFEINLGRFVGKPLPAK